MLTIRWFCKHCNKFGELSLDGLVSGSDFQHKVMEAHGRSYEGFLGVCVSVDSSTLIRACRDSGTIRLTTEAPMQVLVFHVQ